MMTSRTGRAYRSQVLTASRTNRYGRLLRAGLLASTAITPAAAYAQDLPTGGAVAHGNAVITSAGGAMDITQSTDRAILNWQGFSIGSGNTVRFHQPGPQSTALNRVQGGLPSRIDGNLSANGSVFLINPNGVVIGPGGRVNTGSFLASTLSISDDDFLAGTYRFDGNGASAAVENHGVITAMPGGYAALLGGAVTNSGTIAVPQGRVGLGAGEAITLDFSGDGFLQVAVPSASEDAGIEHSGHISADGGTVVMSVAAARDAARNVINLSGVVEARSVSGRNGHIRLGGGGGNVRVSGRLDASGPLDARGGDIILTGAGMFIAPEGRIDASGTEGGGVIRIGGGWQGGEDLPWSYTTVVENGAEIRADGLSFGNGGSVAVWSEAATDFEGTISVTGGPQGGDGGAVELSSAGVLSLGGSVDRSAPNGAAGSLLLDPFNVTISASSDSVDIFVTEDGFTGFNSEETSVLNVDDLLGFLVDGDVTVDTFGPEGGGSQAGDIVVEAALAWSDAHDLTLSADNNLEINAPITAPEGGLILDAGGDITTDSSGAIDVGYFELVSGAWRQVGDLPAFEAGDFRGGVGSGGRSFLRALGGSGTPGDPYLITDIYGLQGIDSASLLSSSFALANDIDASGTAFWRLDPETCCDFEGFDRIGTSELAFGGTLDGRGFSISDLTMDQPGLSRVGMIAINAGTVSDLDLVDVLIFGGEESFSQTGAVAAENTGTIENVTVSGGIVGDGETGGIVGRNTGTIRRADFSGLVEGLGDSTGGIAGNNSGAITASRLFGEVNSRGNLAGGIAGLNEGDVTDSLSLGSVSSNFEFDNTFVYDISGAIGGIAGANIEGTVERVGFEGELSAEPTDTFPSEHYVGGVVGYNQGTLRDSYSTGSIDVVTPGNAFVGGIAGIETPVIPFTLFTIENSFAAGPISVTLTDDLGVSVGGVAGAHEGRIIASFWDVEATGVESGVGFETSGASVSDYTGLATVDMQDMEGFMSLADGWDFFTVWAPPGNGEYARNYTTSPVIYVVPDDVEVDAGDDYDLTFTVYGGPGVYVFDDDGSTLGPVGISPTGETDPGSYDIVTASSVSGSDGTEFEVISAAATLTVNEVPNLPPTVITDAGPFSTEGEPIDVDLLDNIEDPDGDDLTVDVLTEIDDSTGTISDNGDGTITFTPAEGFEGEVEVEYEVFDGINDPINVSVIIEVTPPTFGPTAVPDFAATESGVGVTIDILANDTAGSDGELSLAEAGLVESPGTLSVNEDGTITYTPPEDFSGTAFIEYEVIDGAETGDIGSVEVTVVAGTEGPEEEVIIPPIIPPTELPNPNDTLTVPSIGTGQVAGITAVSAESAQETLEATADASGGFELVVARCQRDQDAATTDSLACISEALEQYGSVLAELEREYSESLQGVSAIIRDARTGIDAAIARAETRLATAATPAERAAIEAEAIAEARAAVQTAQERIRSAITLVKADDPVIERLQVEQGNVIFAALSSVEVELSRAADL